MEDKEPANLSGAKLPGIVFNKAHDKPEVCRNKGKICRNKSYLVVNQCETTSFKTMYLYIQKA